eukprot:jgi/Tetstr1/460303/TSEL_005603.t1
MPEGKPSYLPGRPIFHSHKDGRGKTVPLSEVEAEKRFDDMESHILFLAAKFDFCADDIEEWVHTLRELREKQWEESRPFDKFWHEDAQELQYWLQNRPPCPARGAAADTGTAAQHEAGPAAHNARNAAELPHNAEAAVGRMIAVMECLRRLEWNPVTTIGPGKTNDDSIKQIFDAGQGNLIRSHKDLKDPDESKRQLNLVSYEPWVPDRSGNPEIPQWLAVDIARIEGRPVPDTSWEVAQTMPWRPVAALPMRSERVDGVYLPQDSLDHLRLRLEYIELKIFLTAFQNNDPGKMEAARKMRLVQACLSKGRKRARELAEMDIDPNAQVARLHCADLFDLDYHHH